MALRPNMELQDFLEIFRRRKWIIVFSTLMILFGAVVYSVLTPNMYRSTTTILVIPQKVPESYVRSTVSYSVQDRLLTIQKQVLSRTRLLSVIDELGLFQEKRGEIPEEDLVKSMHRRIKIEVVRGKDAIELSFLHEEPRMAMITTSKLASFFIEENLRVREQQAAGTSEFLEAQLAETKRRLEEQEERVKQYKLAYMGELPQQIQPNLSHIERMQDQIRSNQEEIARLEDRKVLYESQLSDLENQIRAIEDPTGDNTASYDPTMQLRNELAIRRRKLQDLTLKYKPNYPSVVQAEREIEELETRILEMQRASGSGSLSSSENQRVHGGTAVRAVRERNQAGAVRERIAAINLEIAAKRREIESLKVSINRIQEKVERLPQREQEMISLTRDYDNLKRNYDDLLKKKLEAEISQNLEARQKGEQFQVLDPATLPIRPYSPDRQKILGIAFLVAIAFGFGGSLGLEFLDQTLRSPRDFRHHFDLPVLATIPIIQDAHYARKTILHKAVVLGGLLSFASALIAFILLYSERIWTILQF